MGQSVEGNAEGKGELSRGAHATAGRHRVLEPLAVRTDVLAGVTASRPSRGRCRKGAAKRGSGRGVAEVAVVCHGRVYADRRPDALKSQTRRYGRCPRRGRCPGGWMTMRPPCVERGSMLDALSLQGKRMYN